MSLCSELRLANISTKLEIQDRPEYGNIDSLSVYNILLLPFVILKMSVTVCEYSPESCVYENNNLTIITKPPLPNYLSASIDIIVVIALYSGTVQLLHNNFSQNLPPSLKRNTRTEIPLLTLSDPIAIKTPAGSSVRQWVAFLPLTEIMRFKVLSQPDIFLQMDEQDHMDIIEEKSQKDWLKIFRQDILQGFDR